MSEFVQNNADTYIGDNSNNGQGLDNQASYNVPSNPHGMPLISPELTSNIKNPNY